jgi:hypothetical protein
MEKMIPCPALEFYQELEEWAVDSIRASQGSIALMAEIREKFVNDWEIEELTRAIIFEQAQITRAMGGEAEYARAAGKGLKKLSR